MKNHPNKTLMRFKVNGKSVAITDERIGNLRVQRLYTGDYIIGTIQTKRGENKVYYKLTQWYKPKFKYVGARGRTKEALLRDCRRILIREANATARV